MIRLLSGVFLGWGLGANDSANVFGTAVSSKMIKYSSAVICTAVFVIAGALLQGQEGMHTLQGLTDQSIQTAFISSLAAAITVLIMTILKLPVSTSQAVVGAIIGIGFLQHDLDLSSLGKVVICWVGTPIGGFILALILYGILTLLFKVFRPHLFNRDTILRLGLLGAGCYGAYALGANNVANVTGIFVGVVEISPGIMLNTFQAVLIGGISIALGALTYSKKVMVTVGRSIVKLDAFSALVTVMAHSITVHIYALLGVPVSSTQAIIGAVLAIGLIQGTQTINFKMLAQVLSGWLLTPVLAAFLSSAIYYITHLRYIP